MQMRGCLANQVLDPVTTNDFFEHYWEKTLLHVTRDNTAHFKPLISGKSIEQALTSRDLYFPDVQLTQHDRTVPVADYAPVNNKIAPLRVIEQHKLGATVVMSQAHRLFGELGSLCRQLQASLHMRCQANVYLSPRGNQGFNAHYDTHDVIILQVQGTKTFNIYSGGPELPFTDDQFDPALIPDITLQQSVTLTAGDTLYIPRGVVHDAVAAESSDGSSLHITLGLFPLVVRDLLQEMVQVVAERDQRYRQSVTNGVSADPSLLRDLLAKGFDDDVIQTSLSRLTDEIAVQSDQDCSGMLAAETDFNADTQLSIKHHMIVSLEQQDSKTILRSFGQVLEFNESMSSALNWILQQEKFTQPEIPDLSREQADALVRRLIGENIVGVAP